MPNLYSGFYPSRHRVLPARKINDIVSPFSYPRISLPNTYFRSTHNAKGRSQNGKRFVRINGVERMSTDIDEDEFLKRFGQRRKSLLALTRAEGDRHV